MFADLLIPLVLLLLGLGLVVVEVYLVPGFNVVGIVGFLLILFGVGYAFADAGLVEGSITLVSSVLGVGGVFYWLWKSGAWERFVLSANLRADDRLVARESEYRARYLGKVGLAVTPLRPTGVVEIEGERIEAVTEGEFIAAGSQVRVVAMDRRRYFVRLATALKQVT